MSRRRQLQVIPLTCHASRLPTSPPTGSLSPREEGEGPNLDLRLQTLDFRL
jgi:hypothetical protein